MTQVKRSEHKPRKYNPKPGKVCVGQFLMQLYQPMQKVLQDQNVALPEKNAASWAMNCILAEVMGVWCKCPWCRNGFEKMKEYYKKTEVSSVKEDKHE